MLKIIDSNLVERTSLIRARYPRSKFLIKGDYDCNDPKGKLYAVSTDKSSFKEICHIMNEMCKKGESVTLMGSYHDV